jgi:hypothetical protein
VAVTGIISQQKHPLQFLKVGFAWGIGHTMMLLTVGALVLVLKVSISDSLSAVLESIVGMTRGELQLNLKLKMKKEKLGLKSILARSGRHIRAWELRR